MSTNSDRKRPIGRPVAITRIVNQALCEKAFSLIELLTVIIIIGVMLGSVTLMYVLTERSTDAQSAAEMFKEDVRKTRDLAGLGASLGAGGGVDSAGIRHRDKYRILINANSGSPPNCYKIETCMWTDPDYGRWTEVNIRNAEARKIVTDVDTGRWIKPSSSSDITIAKVGADGQPTGDSQFSVEFESKGSIVQTTPLADTVIRLGNSSKHVDITISMYGDISE